MIRRSMLAALALFGLCCGAVAARAGCTLKFVDIPVTMSNLRATVEVKINDQPAVLAIDSGAFYSFISQPSAERLHLPMRAAPPDMDVVRGINGDSYIFLTTIKRLTIGTSVLPGLDFTVGGAALGDDVAGLLGENLLARGDVEYDFGHGAMKLVNPTGCGNQMLAYWDKTDPFSVIDIAPISQESDHILGSAQVNGANIRVMFDTGAPTSFLTLAAAKRAGIDVRAPGVVAAGVTTGLGRGALRTWIAPVKSFKIGDEEIRNTHIRVGDAPLFERDMLIGADFFLSHHIYVANSQRKLYFTYNGGAVFNLTVDDASSAPAAAPTNAGTDPTDAAGFSRRGAAFLARDDYDGAIADLTRAMALAPTDPAFVNQRAEAYMRQGKITLALADLDLAVKLDPAGARARLARARIHLANRRTAEALIDLDAAAVTAARQSEAHKEIGDLYLAARAPTKAAQQFEIWLETHPVDAEKYPTLGSLCWAKALTGQDLRGALEDCNAALNIIPKDPALLDSRGLVWLRMGRFDKAIQDYDVALAARPKQAWSLYGRGLAKLKSGQADAGKADMAAAVGLQPGLPDEARGYGIIP